MTPERLPVPPTTTRPDPFIPEMGWIRFPGWRWVIAIVVIWVFAIAANIAYLRWVKS